MAELVSVVMSTYNENEEELTTSIGSMLEQSYEQIEVIIVNDNPENMVIDRAINRFDDSRIIYIKNEKNIGLSNSLNKGLQYARGEYIARMDADDISNKNRLEKQLIYIKKNNYDLIGCGVNCIDENGKPVNRNTRVPVNEKEIRKKNRWKACLAHPTFFAKRIVYDSLHGYRNIEYCEDYDFVCRCIASGYRLGNLPEKLLYYRIRENGITQTNALNQKLRSYYIGGMGTRILETSEDEIQSYFASQRYRNEIVKYMNYLEGKKELRKANICNMLSGIKKMSNKYLLYAIMGKL